MSCITENTIVIKKENETQLLKDYEKYECDHRLSGFNRVYDGTDICVYVFDANGDGPWEIEPDTVEWMALETYYLDDEELWTRFSDESTQEETIAEWLKGIILEPEYSKVIKSISYSSGEEE